MSALSVDLPTHDHHDTIETMSGISWPYRDADKTLNPLTPGQLVIAAGRPGAGKSVLCVDVARHAALTQGKTVVLHSMEMGRAEIMLRIIAAEARVNLSSLQSKDLTEEQWARIEGVSHRLRDADLHIIDEQRVTLDSLRATIDNHDPDLVVIDHLQLVTLDAKADRRQALEEFTRGLKLTAKAAGIPILTAAQLGRGPEMRQDHTPMLSDLRETGSLENDADTVLLLHRPDAHGAEPSRAGEADLIVAQQHDGPVGTVRLVHQFHYSRFVPADEAPTNTVTGDTPSRRLPVSTPEPSRVCNDTSTPPSHREGNDHDARR